MGSHEAGRGVTLSKFQDRTAAVPTWRRSQLLGALTQPASISVGKALSSPIVGRRSDYGVLDLRAEERDRM